MTSLAMTVGSFTAKSMSGTNGSPYAGALASMFGPSSVNGGCTSMLGGSVIAFVGIVFSLSCYQVGFNILIPMMTNRMIAMIHVARGAYGQADAGTNTPMAVRSSNTQ